jgi:hypothetical protein
MQSIEVIVPHNNALLFGFLRQSIGGKYFRIVETTGPLYVTALLGSRIVFPRTQLNKTGGFGSETTEFNTLLFGNYNGADVTATILASDSPLDTPPTLDPGSNESPATTTFATSGNLGAGATDTIQATSNMKRLRQLIVTNLDAANSLKIRKGGVNCATVFPQTSWTAEFVGEEMQVHNPNGAAVPREIAAIYYV